MRRALIVMLGMALVAGCGDDDGDTAEPPVDSPTPTASATASPTTEASPTAESASPDAGALTVAAREPGAGQYAFAPETLTAPAGSVTITMSNPASNKAPHAVALEGSGVAQAGETVSPGSGESIVTAELAAGEYKYYCPVGNHRAEGMEGTLTVE